MPNTDLSPLEARLGHTFHDQGLLRLALTHSSIAHEAEANVQHNQRLEFLGDAALGIIITRELICVSLRSTRGRSRRRARSS